MALRHERLRTSDPMFAFSATQVRKVTGLTDRQLRYWDQTQFFSPTYGEADRHRPYSRVYSFRDLVGLRTIAELRSVVPLQQLRRLGAWLSEHYETPWSSLKFSVAGQRIYFRDPETGQWIVQPGQAVLQDFHLEEIAEQTTEEAQRLLGRQPEDIGRVTRNRFVVHNKPVLAGTRIPTSAIWNFHVAGYSPQEIIRQYPRLTLQDIRAALDWENESRERAAG